MFNIIIHIIFITVFVYCAFSVLYLFILSVAGRFFYYAAYNEPFQNVTKRIAILVPAYKEDEIIFSTTNNLTTLNYPEELFDVYIITDSFKQKTLEQLRKLSVNIFEVSFKKSTKTKSLNEAFKRINKLYDIALICDADNMLAPDFLKQINNAFFNGAKSVQGRRVAKNLDSPFAILDACSEAINNNIFRKGTNAVGLSSAVIGSGMAFDFEMIKNIFAGISAVGGFDKILQLKVVEQNIKIQYLENALIFDEKISSSHAFKQQRKRWVSSQFIYLKKFFVPGVKQLFKGNLSYFNLAVLNNIILPRAILLMILPLLIITSFFIPPFWFVAAVILCIAYILCLIISLPAQFINKDLFSAIIRLPKAIALMCANMFQLKNANNNFIHTIHTKTEISNSLINERR